MWLMIGPPKMQLRIFSPCATANSAIALRLQSTRPVGRVAELGSLIWLKSVKRTVLLVSESFHFSFDFYFTAFLTGSETGTLSFLRLSMLRYVSPLARFTPGEVINRSRSDAALASV